MLRILPAKTVTSILLVPVLADIEPLFMVFQSYSLLMADDLYPFKNSASKAPFFVNFRKIRILALHESVSYRFGSIAAYCACASWQYNFLFFRNFGCLGFL